MTLIERYEKDGHVVEVNSLLTTRDSVIDIKQLYIIKDIAYVCFDTQEDRVLMTEPAESFIAKHKEYLNTLTKKATVYTEGCGCNKCK